MRLGAFGMLAAGLMVAAASSLSTGASAQTLTDRVAGASGGNKGPMVVEANEVVYDDKTHAVSAVGDAQIYYEGKILEADRVTYFKDTGRVLAEGSVKLTEPDGSVTHAERMELSGDFKEGFVDTLRADTKERTHLGATRSDKVDAGHHRFPQGNLHRLPELRETSGARALVAAAGQEDHSQE